MKTPKYYSRKFLNKTRGTATVEIDGNSSSWHISMDVAISDCNRKICLEFYANNSKEIKDKIAKLDLLISELNKAKEFFVNEAVPFFESEQKKKKDAEEIKPKHLIEAEDD